MLGHTVLVGCVESLNYNNESVEMNNVSQYLGYPSDEGWMNFSSWISLEKYEIAEGRYMHFYLSTKDNLFDLLRIF